mgnify:CR=1 FL=1
MANKASNAAKGVSKRYPGRPLLTRDAIIDAARQMGWRTLLVNTPIGNREMLHLYEKIGFRYIERFPECSDPAEVAEFFVYMQLDLV